MPAKKKVEEAPIVLPIYMVALDAESFKWLKDQLAGKNRYHYPAWYLALVAKTLRAFEEAEEAVNGPRKRVIPRKVAKTHKRR